MRQHGGRDEGVTLSLETLPSSHRTCVFRIHNSSYKRTFQDKGLSHDLQSCNREQVYHRNSLSRPGTCSDFVARIHAKVCRAQRELCMSIWPTGLDPI